MNITPLGNFGKNMFLKVNGEARMKWLYTSSCLSLKSAQVMVAKHPPRNATGGQQKPSCTYWSLTSALTRNWNCKAWEDTNRTLTNLVQLGWMFYLSRNSLHYTDHSTFPRSGDYTPTYSSVSEGSPWPLHQGSTFSYKLKTF